MIETMWLDLRFGARLLLRSPGFTAIAVLALALGIGANSTVFSVLNGVVLRPLPYRDPDRLVAISQELRLGGDRRRAALPPQFTQWRDQAQSLEHVSASTTQRIQLTGVEEPEELAGSRVSSGLFTLLGVQPAVGRAFSSAEYDPGAAPVAILSHRLWQRRFAGNRQAIGSVVTLDGERATIAGVMPPAFQFPNDQTELWMPLRLDAGQTSGARRLVRLFLLNVYGRLKPGVTPEQAQAELRALAARKDDLLPPFAQGGAVYVSPLRDDLVANVRPTLWVLAGAVGFILLIACANVANLLLARATTRRQEVAVRAALGASRARLARQLLTESLLLALGGGVVGLVVALGALKILVSFLGDSINIPRLAQVGIDLPVIAFTFCVCLLTGVVFGFAPAAQVFRADLHERLKEGGHRTGSGAGSSRLRSLLVVSEVALSLVLLVGAGLMIRSVLSLQAIDMGFVPERLLTVRIPGGGPGASPETLRQLLERVEKMPGVRAAGLATVLPLGGMRMRINFQVEGQPEPEREEDRVVDVSNVSPRFFETMGMRLVQGRVFADQDSRDTAPVMVINETMARRFWPGQDPVGRMVRMGGPDAPPARVVGVVRDIRQRLLDAGAGPFVYLPYSQVEGLRVPGTLLARTEGNPMNRVAMLRSELRSLFPGQVIPEIGTMEQGIARSISDRRVLMVLLGCLAGLALALAAAGIYGAVSYSVNQRTHEMGVRIALGARAGDVLRLVVGHSLLLAFIGVAAGVAGALALTRLLANQLYGVSRTDPLTFTGVAVLLAVVAALAGYIPARRAAKVDPVVALRHE